MITMWDDFKTAVQAIDVAGLDRTGLGDLAAEIGATRAVLDGLEARTAVELRRLGASEASTAETLRRRTGCSAREAKHRTRRAETLEKMPNVADALSSGRLTGEHASALARAAAETSPEAVDRDAGLLAEAESLPADVASSKTRDWVRRRQTDDDLQRLHQWQRRNRSLLFAAGEGGMIAGIAKFDRVSGAQFQNLVESLADRLYRADGGRDNPHARSRAQCRHDALLTLVGIEPSLVPHPRGADSGSHTPNPGPIPAPSQIPGPKSIPGSHTANPGGAPNGKHGSGLFVPRQEPLPHPGASPVPGSGSSPNSGSGLVPGSGSSPNSGSGLVPGSGSSPNSGSGLVPGSGSSPNSGSGLVPGSGSSPNSGSGLVPGSGSSPNLSPRPSPGCTCGRGFGAKAQLCIVMDLTYLATNGESGRCEIPGIGAIARNELQRLGCDAEIYGIIFDEHGLPLHHSRKTRTVSPQQWRVLLARDRGCVICGANPSLCQAHHVKFWSLGGPTDIDNLVLLCHAHHRWVHDNEITLRRGPDGWHAPTGLPPPRQRCRG